MLSRTRIGWRRLQHRDFATQQAPPRLRERRASAICAARWMDLFAGEQHAAVEPDDWIAICAHQLQRQWRTVDPEQLDEVAADLWGDPRLRAMAPEDAAVIWLATPAAA